MDAGADTWSYGAVPGEDPELTRLAAERYSQYKLDQLDAAEVKAAAKS